MASLYLIISSIIFPVLAICWLCCIACCIYRSLIKALAKQGRTERVAKHCVLDGATREVAIAVAARWSARSRHLAWGLPVGPLRPYKPTP